MPCTPNAWAQPLPHVQKKDFRHTTPAEAPDQAPLFKALNMLSQRLLAIENQMFQKLI